MVTENRQEPLPVCFICLKESLSENWVDWFGDFEFIPQEDGSTLLRKDTNDQSLILGTLEKIHGLGLSFELVLVAPTFEKKPFQRFLGTASKRSSIKWTQRNHTQNKKL